MGAASPIHDFGLVDHEVPIVDGDQAGRFSERTIDIDHPAARSADQVVVVVADAVLKASRRAGGFDAADDASLGEDRQGVIDGLP